MNPIIKLSPNNANKIIFTFINYDSNNDNNDIGYENNQNNFSNDNDGIIWGKRKEYDSVKIDEKLSITDLVGELDIIKKQNNIALNKMNKLNNMNKKFNDDYKILEENFRITLSKINEKNSNSYIKGKIYKANEKSENIQNIIKQKKTSINKINKLKKEFEYLNNEYS